MKLQVGREKTEDSAVKGRAIETTERKLVQQHETEKMKLKKWEAAEKEDTRKPGVRGGSCGKIYKAKYIKRGG